MRTALIIVMSLVIGTFCGRCAKRDAGARMTSSDFGIPAETTQPRVEWTRDQPSCRNEQKIAMVGFPGTPPRVVAKVEPELSPSAAPVRGIVIVEAIIDLDGRPCSIVVLKPLRGDADAAAVAAVRDWLFVPAQWQGEPWYAVYNIAVRVDHAGRGAV